MRAFAMTEAMWLRAGRGEPLEALRGYREVVETWFQGGDWANQWLSLRHVAGVLADPGATRTPRCSSGPSPPPGRPRRFRSRPPTPTI